MTLYIKWGDGKSGDWHFMRFSLDLGLVKIYKMSVPTLILGTASQVLGSKVGGGYYSGRRLSF